MPGRATLTMVTSIATNIMETDVMIRICQARAPTCTSSAAGAVAGGACGSVVNEPHRRPRLSAARRGGARVTNLELFFDLVFVLAVTQCTASIEHDPSWTGVA